MAFILNTQTSIRRGLKHIVRRELWGASESLRRNEGNAVHEARKSVKNVRAVVTLLQEIKTDAFEKDTRRLSSAGQTLSVLRDADAVIATFDHLRAHFPKRLSESTYAIVRQQLVRSRARLIRDPRVRRRLVHVAQSLRAVRRSVKRWPVPSIPVSEGPALLTHGYRASRKAMKRAQTSPSPLALHRWRKRVKTLWYQLRVAHSLTPSLGLEIRRLKQLETWLGELHDLFVLQTTMRDDTGLQRMRADVRTLVAMSSAVQTELQRKSFALGGRLLAARPKAFRQRLRRAFSL